MRNILNMHKKLSKAAPGRAGPGPKQGHGQRRRKQCPLRVGCWNMRTLVESEGPIETSVARPGGRGVPVERKASLMVGELKRYGVNVTGISETKWFGQSVYDIEDFTIIHSGRHVPDEAPLHRSEGVGIVLDTAMAAAWREAGEEWKAVSPRVVRARLKLSSDVRHPTYMYMTIVSVYAPTFRSSAEEKERFYSDLQLTLDEVSQQDLLMLVGDFNARVGSEGPEGNRDVWSGVRGPHGVGEMNEAGRDLLSFCALNELAIMNTCFEKKRIHKFTWQHPGNKKWHCIDYIIMRQKQRRFCCHAGVICSADCWTDHKFLCAKIMLKMSPKPAAGKPRPRFAVSNLTNPAVREAYSDTALREVSREWNPEADGERKWNDIKEGMNKAAAQVLGQVKRRQPDWFRDNQQAIEPLISKRNAAFSRWLRSQSPRDRQRYVEMRRRAAHEVKHCKNVWFQEKAKEVERAVRAGKGGWKELRELQRGRAGLRPVKPRAIRDGSGSLCTGRDSVLQRWHQHFQGVLNVQSSYDIHAIEEVEGYPERSELADPPTEEEVVEALRKMKVGKAGGKSGILPEMVRGCAGQLMDFILDMFHTVWSEQRVPHDWRDALLVPIPKKGDLSLCDNWRGISLLDVVGKVFARVIQARLQSVAEEVLPDSQCGFRAGRGCADMIFCAQQLMEKAREHNTSLYLLFVDLRKAYDSVPREALWKVLGKYGIPPPLVNIIRSLHEGMKAEVTVDNASTPEIEVTNGLRQGCTIAPTLFNLYFNLVMDQWRKRVQPFGVEVLYKCGGKLVGERTRRPVKATVTELQFADDAALVGSSREEIERAAETLDRVATEWGLTLSLSKTKLLMTGKWNEADIQPIIVRGEPIEAVSQFRYLGSVVESHGEVLKDVEDRIAKASRAFGALCKPVFQDSSLSLRTKRMVYRAVVMGVLLYGSEAWTNKRAATSKLESFNNKCLRRVLGITRAQQRVSHITSAEVRKRFGIEELLEDVIAAKRLRWIGHVARMDDTRLPKQLLFGWLPHHRPAHGTKQRWRDKVRKDLKTFGIDEGRWFHVAQDRREWRALCREGLVEITEHRQERIVNRMRAATAAAPSAHPTSPLVCPTCSRAFRRRQDIARHKCVTTRPRKRTWTGPTGAA